MIGIAPFVHTHYWKVKAYAPERDKIVHAAALVAGGGVVAFPTETVYGLGADAFNPEAVDRIFEAKGRPSDNPLIVHIAFFWQLERLVSAVPPQTLTLALKFWPGPLTLVLPKGPAVPSQVTAGLDTVALRMPGHRVALELIRVSGCPIAAPSANLSGRPSPTTARHVLRQMYGRADAILDGGPSVVGVESTVLDLTRPVPVILRPGGVTREQLEAEIGRVETSGSHPEPEADFVPRAPGMKYRHYAPQGTVRLVDGGAEEVAARISELAAAARWEGKRVGVLCSRENFPYYRELAGGLDFLETLGSRDRPGEIARRLYGALYRCDLNKIDQILVEAFPTGNIGTAVMNRLLKAADNKVEKV